MAGRGIPGMADLQRFLRSRTLPFQPSTPHLYPLNQCFALLKRAVRKLLPAIIKLMIAVLRS